MNGHQRQGGPASENEAENAAETREQDGLRQHLANHATAGSAEGRARGEFFSAAVGASENEIGDVGAGDEKNESNEQHEDECCGGHETALRPGSGRALSSGKTSRDSLCESPEIPEPDGGRAARRRPWPARSDAGLEAAKNAKEGSVALVEIIRLGRIEKTHGREGNIEVRLEEVVRAAISSPEQRR